MFDVRDSGGKMPYVQITWLEGRSTEQKRKIAERITNTLIEEGKAQLEHIHVTFLDLPTTNYAVFGKLVSDQKTSPQTDSRLK
jgi:4-oxalocrotonate tautomerase